MKIVTMDAFRKNLIIVFIIMLVFAVAWFLRLKNERGILLPDNQIELRGTTMGTYYSIKYLDEGNRNFNDQIDSILHNFNQSLSTYIPGSEISRFNRQDTLKFDNPFFLPVLEKSKEIYKKTGGAFDPTVMPLVNAWGFGPLPRTTPDSTKIDSLLQLVGFNKVAWNHDKVYKLQSNVQLDFSAVAKGYGVDVIAEFLQEQGIKNLLVEIGGEIMCRGKNEQGNIWRVGIPNPLPSESGSFLYASITLDNAAIATSGNYMNYYETNGKIISHTISPFTGYPVVHEVLSASVLASDCMTADAYATAFMVLGLEKSKEILENDDELEGYLIYVDENDNLASFFTPGLKALLNEMNNKH
jgi:FAD:protein FMN transferase